ncbi:MAG TPA: M23 family metallopeptidase [Usitatibacter sp.]|nr:M23 family metallopeptidase [Usitatibacter sp.]
MKIAPVLAGLLAAAAAHATGLDIRFYPSTLHTYPLASDRGLSSLVIQNTAFVNQDTRPIKITSVAFEVLANNNVAETRSLHADDLAKSIAAGQRVQGMLDLLDFQFGGEALLPKGGKLATSTTLAPGEALYVGSQVFALRGPRTEVRVIVVGSAGDALVTSAASVRVAGESQNAYRLPVKGTWLVGAGPTLHSQHRWAVPEEFAFDLMKAGPDGVTHRGDGTHRTDYLAYGEPVFAAAQGKVVAAVNGEPETDDDLQRPDENPEAYLARVQATQMERLKRGVAAVAGNHVVIEHADNEYSLYAHLKPGSVEVKAGDRVAVGQRIGTVGTSGNSTEPHLHFQVGDGADPLHCAGIPIRFENLSIRNADFPRPPQTGDFVSSSP